MAKDFGDVERKVKSLFNTDAVFIFNHKQYKVIESGKPTCKHGEPKTDVYVLAKELTTCENYVEFKISVKKSNAEFMENKISALRAENIFGPDWKKVLTNSIEQIKEKFEQGYLIYFKNANNTQRGGIKLGWKFEIFRTLQGKLSEKILLEKKFFEEVLSGKNLIDDKKNSSVNANSILNSGVANYIVELPIDISQISIQKIVDSLVSIEDYASSHDYYFGCKALNYRVFKESKGRKWDDNRPLAVYVKWSIINDKLTAELVLDKPLEISGNELGNNMSGLLDKLKINKNNFDDLKKYLDKKIKYCD